MRFNEIKDMLQRLNDCLVPVGLLTDDQTLEAFLRAMALGTPLAISAYSTRTYGPYKGAASAALDSTVAWLKNSIDGNTPFRKRSSKTSLKASARHKVFMEESIKKLSDEGHIIERFVGQEKLILYFPYKNTQKTFEKAADYHLKKITLQLVDVYFPQLQDELIKKLKNDALLKATKKEILSKKAQLKIVRQNIKPLKEKVEELTQQARTQLKEAALLGSIAKTKEQIDLVETSLINIESHLKINALLTEKFSLQLGGNVSPLIIFKKDVEKQLGALNKILDSKKKNLSQTLGQLKDKTLFPELNEQKTVLDNLCKQRDTFKKELDALKMSVVQREADIMQEVRGAGLALLTNKPVMTL